MFKSLGMIGTISFKGKLFANKEYIVCHPSNISRFCTVEAFLLPMLHAFTFSLSGIMYKETQY